MTVLEWKNRWIAAQDAHSTTVMHHRLGIATEGDVIRAERARSEAFKQYHSALIDDRQRTAVRDIMACGHA